MASSSAAAQLTEGHRLAQNQLAARTVQLLRSSWPLLDPADLDESVARWLRVTVPLVQRQRRMSAMLAAHYMRAFRAVELGVMDSFDPLPVDLDDAAQIATSLTVTGPVTVKEQMKRLAPLQTAMQLAEAKSAGAGMRHALNGGRATILDNVRRDRRAHGWARVVSGKPCSFCLMLASRGPVYREDTAGFDAHDNCSCSAEPIYRRDAAWPPGSREAQDLWNEAKRMDGDTAINFRRLVEGRA